MPLIRPTRGFFAIACYLAWLVCTFAPAGELACPAEEMEGSLVGDPQKNGAPVIEITDGKKLNALVGEATPGVYTLALTGRFHGQRAVHYRITLSVMLSGKRIFTTDCFGNTFPDSTTWHTLRIPHIVVPQKGELSVQADYSSMLNMEFAKAFANQQLLKMKDPEMKSGLTEEDDTDDIELEEKLPAPSGIAGMLLAEVRAIPQPTPIAITRIWPKKIHCYPEETNPVAIDLQNTASTPSNAILLVERIRGLDDVNELVRKPLTIPARKTLTETVAVEGKEEYGQEIRVSLLDDAGKVLNQRSEYYSVSENVFEVSINGFCPGLVGRMIHRLKEQIDMPEEKLQKQATAAAHQSRAGYINHVEFFSWAPDDFFNLAPEEEGWWSGTMTFIISKRHVMAMNKAFQAEGMKTLTYAQPYAIGLDTVRVLRTNPEFFGYSGNGVPLVNYEYDLMKSRALIDQLGARPKELSGGLNFFNLATVDRGIDAVIDSAKMFGWDGVRYDNRYYRANNPITYTGERATTVTDLDPYSARNVKRQKNRFWKELNPRFLISHNNGYRFNHAGNILGWEETVKDGLMCMDEETCNHAGSWKDFMLYGLTARRRCTELGGYYQLFPPERGSVPPADILFHTVSCVASGSHVIMVPLEGVPAGHYGKFLTRFSAMVYARDIKPLEKPETYLSIPGVPEEKLWWKPFANERTHKGKRWLLFSLVVAPKLPNIKANPECLLPPALHNTKIVLPQAAYPTKPRAFLLSAERDEMLTTLSLEKTATGYAATLPPVAHYGLLVIETNEGGSK